MLDGSWLTAFPGQKAKEEKTPKYSRHKATTKSRGPYENLTTYSQTTGPAHCATSFLFFFLAISARAARFAHLTRILHWLSLLPAILEARPTERFSPFADGQGRLPTLCTRPTTSTQCHMHLPHITIATENAA